MKRDLTVSACILAGCILMYREAAQLPEPRFELLGPAFFPKLILGAIIACTLLDMVLTVIKNARGNASANAAVESSVEPSDENSQAANEKKPEAGQKASNIHTGIVLPIVIVLYFAIYTLLISYSPVPYLVLTFLYILATSWTLAFLSKKSFLPSALTALGVTAFIYVGFVYGLELILP